MPSSLLLLVVVVAATLSAIGGGQTSAGNTFRAHAAIDAPASSGSQPSTAITAPPPSPPRRTARGARSAVTSACVVTTVSDTANSTGTTLRQCIDELNSNVEGGGIHFNVKPSNTSNSDACNVTIQLKSSLPIIKGA